MSRRAGAPLALLTLALAVAAPAPAAGLADTLAAADAALRSALGTDRCWMRRHASLPGAARQIA